MQRFLKKTQEGLLIVLQCVYNHGKAGQKSEENMYHDDCNKSKERIMKANLGKCLLADGMLCLSMGHVTSHRSGSSYVCTCSIK